ncbi:hypothetical protein [Lysobacter capsici]|uniref:hypothetical protein n=1 Tax=Lysobacter capsici TaxID=435897 RepID=UPI001C008689|nr:hypothetical protein [Lysobacter capsici]QWF17441.1 hypothetical protein KME82_01150 [Lysobacter capsici]
MANLDAARWSGGADQSNYSGVGEDGVRARGRRRFLAHAFGAGRMPAAFETAIEWIALPARDQARVAGRRAAGCDGVIDERARVGARRTRGCGQARCNRGECDLRGHRRSPDERKRQRPPGQVSSD